MTKQDMLIKGVKAMLKDGFCDFKEVGGKLYTKIIVISNNDIIEMKINGLEIQFCDNVAIEIYDYMGNSYMDIMQDNDSLNILLSINIKDINDIIIKKYSL